jgi:serine/threonine-protein kinase
MGEFVGALRAALLGGQTLAAPVRGQAANKVTPAPQQGASPHPTTVSYPSGVTTLSGGAHQSLSGSSKPAAQVAAVERRKRRLGLGAAVIGAGAVVTVLVIRFSGPGAALPVASAPGALPAATPAPGAAAVAPSVAPPARPSPAQIAPAPIEIALGSEPEGATVTLDGVVVGTTPATFSLRGRETPIELVFTRDGHEPQTVKALVSPGLRLKPRLIKLQKAERSGARSATRRASPTPAPAPSPRFDDIKSER